jgi:lysophospholipase L1-like esterase
MFARKVFYILLFFIISASCSAQELSQWMAKSIDSLYQNTYDEEQNNLKNTQSLLPFLNKLQNLKNGGKQNAVIVQIGDSHIQADMMSAVVRTAFQNSFGNAGRGLVFPYQVAKTNAPSDLIFSSKSSWKANRVAKIDTIPSCGISGFGMESQEYNPYFNFEFRTFNATKESFDKVSFFTSAVSEILLEYNDNQIKNVCFDAPTDFYSVDFASQTSGFKLTFPTTDNIGFYGASLERKDSSGVIYHAIGANGAKYSDYNKTILFWKQLAQLHADCYVISLGTNEAQDLNLTAAGFLNDVKIMIGNLKKVSPNASIIITTPPVSYYKKLKPNPILEIIAQSIIDYCTQNDIAYWDLFGVSKGKEGASKWKSLQLLRPDLVHFSREGYTLQGDLFVHAFAKAYIEFSVGK